MYFITTAIVLYFFHMGQQWTMPWYFSAFISLNSDLHSRQEYFILFYFISFSNNKSLVQINLDNFQARIWPNFFQLNSLKIHSELKLCIQIEKEKKIIVSTKMLPESSLMLMILCWIAPCKFSKKCYQSVRNAVLRWDLGVYMKSKNNLNNFSTNKAVINEDFNKRGLTFTTWE